MPARSLRIRALAVDQPIGEFYVGVIGYKDLIDISFADMRQIEGDLDRYVGIQRRLSADRVREIGAFVNTIDATFPTSIVLSVPGVCAEYDSKKGELVLTENTDEEGGQLVPYEKIAKILDGQHRIEGLKALAKGPFELPVSIFVEADIADEAFVFATVNLAQTKVNRSLVYDLLDYSRARSPQRTCHDVAVALDKHEKSPLRGTIKRLGTATPGRVGETLAQATFVNCLLPFITTDALGDREAMARGRTLKAVASDYSKTPFRHLWIKERDTDVARILIDYFNAVANKWPTAWKSREKGDVLARTNGFRALMRLLKNVYLHLRPTDDLSKALVSEDQFRRMLDRVSLKDDDFTTEKFPPGTSGEKRLYDALKEQARV
jgi:DGQHR domain-containing protein